jgi:hypothetical protein
MTSPRFYHIAHGMEPIDKKTLLKVHSAIRNAFKESNQYSECLEQALSKEKGPKGGRRYDCSECYKAFPESQIECDHHPDPVTEYHKRQYQYSPEEYYNRVFFLPIRVLCKSCHQKNTAAQKKLRK